MNDPGGQDGGRSRHRDDGPRRRTQADVEATLRRNYAQVQYLLVDFLAEHLADTSRVFGGDMQKAVLLAILGQAHLSAEHAAGASGRRVTEFPPERRGMTTLRLSDASGIPRETVRRKLMEMARAGWLTREGTFWVLVMQDQTSVVRADLSGIDDRGITRAARLFALLASVLDG